MSTDYPARRDIIRGAAAMALGSFMSPWRGAPALSAANFKDDPFSLGVASGDPRSDGMVLWTRLAPQPLDPEASLREPVAVDWEIAADDTMRQIVRAGSALARPDRAHAIHAEISGLQPDRDYWYRFRAGGVESPIGRTRTTPVPWSPKERLRFAVAACQRYSAGYYSAYRDMVAQNPDMILHLGDYIYEYESSVPGPRKDPVPRAQNLGDYRRLYTIYKMDPDLQAAHACAPWLMTWDDHEVQSDYAGDYSRYGTDPAEFLKQRLAAYRAYFEHMPIRLSAHLIGKEARIYQQAVYGDLAQFNIVDGRQYRDRLACVPNARGDFGAQLADCDEVFDPARTRLGAPQEAWLEDNFGKGNSTWSILAQTTIFGGLRQFFGDGRQGWWTDGWGGYQGALNRMLKLVQERKPKNFITLGGDIHGYDIADIKADIDDPDSATLGSEFVATSISSRGDPFLFQSFKDLMPQNPHVKLIEGEKRGYLLCDIDHKRWRTILRTVDNPNDQNTGFATLAEFTSENGKPGTVRSG